MTKRKSREVLVADESNGDFLLRGFDAKKFGSVDDPCFGKLYKMSTQECSNCGDSEFCSVVYSRSIMNSKKSDTQVFISDDSDEVSRKEELYYNKMRKIHPEKKAKFLTKAKFKNYK